MRHARDLVSKTFGPCISLKRRVPRGRSGARIASPAPLLAIAVTFALLALAPSPARATDTEIADIVGSGGSCNWTGAPDPNGRRWNTSVNGDTVQICWWTLVSEPLLDLRLYVNGAISGFDCQDFGGVGTCQGVLPYTCGKVTFQFYADNVFDYGYSRDVELFPYNSPACLPQCDSCQLGRTGQAAGKPVNVATGKLWYRTTDAQLSGPFGLRFARWYDNQSTYSLDMGFGWRHSYSNYLDLTNKTNGLIVAHDAEDRQTHFNGVGAGGSAYDNTTGSTLALSGDGNTYTLTTWDARVYLFNSSGLLTSLKDRIGNVQTLTRDGAHASRISTVTDALGRSLTFGYDGANRITSVTSSPSGISASFTYDSGTNCGTGNLCSATEPDSNTWHYYYDEDGSGANNLTSVIDPAGVIEEANAYSGDKCTSQARGSPAQNNLSFAYGSNSTTVTDQLGGRPRTRMTRIRSS